MKSCAEGARPYKHTLCFLTHKNFLYRLSFTHGIRCVIILIHALSHSYLLLNLIALYAVSVAHDISYTVGKGHNDLGAETTSELRAAYVSPTREMSMEVEE